MSPWLSSTMKVSSCFSERRGRARHRDIEWLFRYRYDRAVGCKLRHDFGCHLDLERLDPPDAERYCRASGRMRCEAAQLPCNQFAVRALPLQQNVRRAVLDDPAAL